MCSHGVHVSSVCVWYWGEPEHTNIYSGVVLLVPVPRRAHVLRANVQPALLKSNGRKWNVYMYMYARMCTGSLC